MNAKNILLLITFFTIGIASAQSSDDVLNLLIQKGIVKQNDADSIRADYALKQQEVKEKQKFFNVLSSRGINLGGYIQARYQNFQEEGKINGFDIRRARLDIKGAVTPEWDFRLQADFAVNPKLIDAFVGYKPYDYLKITAGQFLIPFGYENLLPDSNNETIDRSQISGLVGRNKDAIGDQNGRDIGVQTSGSFYKTASNRFLFDYYLAYLNGQGINTAVDKNKNKDLVARLAAHPFSYLDFGASYSTGRDVWTTPAKDQDHIRIGGDITFNYERLSVRGEYIQSQEGTYVVAGETVDLIKNGWYAQAAYYILPKKLQAVVKYDTYDPTKNNPKNDITSFTTVGGTYFINDFAKLQLNYKHKTEEGNSINKDEVVAQLQLKF